LPTFWEQEENEWGRESLRQKPGKAAKVCPTRLHFAAARYRVIS
jgi:hypothetical protein